MSFNIEKIREKFCCPRCGSLTASLTWAGNSYVCLNCNNLWPANKYSKRRKHK